MTPLTAIRGSGNPGHAGLVRDEATREHYVRIVTEETLRLEAIVGDLLDLARLEGGGLAIESVDVPVSWLFARVAERHGVVTEPARHRLTTHDRAWRRAITRRRPALEQALQNLVANAVRHTPHGGHVDCDGDRGPMAGVRRRVEVPARAFLRTPAADLQPLLQSR